MYAWQKIYILSFIMSSHCNETAQQYNWKKMQTLLWLYSLNYHIYISATYNIHVRSTMGAKQVNKQKMKWVRLVKPTSTLTMTSLDQALYFSRPQCVCVCVCDDSVAVIYVQQCLLYSSSNSATYHHRRLWKQKRGGTYAPPKSTEGTFICAHSID